MCAGLAFSEHACKLNKLNELVTGYCQDMQSCNALELVSSHAERSQHSH